MSRSEILFNSAQQHIPGGVNSPVRAFKGVGGTPLFLKHAEGAYVVDEDDRRYVDYVGSWGPMILGHSHPDVLEAVRAQLVHGLSYGAPTALETENAEHLRAWLGRLVDSGLVQTVGRTSGKRYFVAPDHLRTLGLDSRTTLSRITPHRLRALVLEDVGCYPGSSSSEINRRIGAEISLRTLRRALEGLASEERITCTGDRRWRRYWPGGQEGD